MEFRICSVHKRCRKQSEEGLKRLHDFKRTPEYGYIHHHQFHFSVWRVGPERYIRVKCLFVLQFPYIFQFDWLAGEKLLYSLHGIMGFGKRPFGFGKRPSPHFLLVLAALRMWCLSLFLFRLISLTWRHRRQNSLPHLSCGISSLSAFSSRQIQHVPLRRYTCDNEARVLWPARVFGVLVLGLVSLLWWCLFSADLSTVEDSLWNSSADMNSEALAASGE